MGVFITYDLEIHVNSVIVDIAYGLYRFLL